MAEPAPLAAHLAWLASISGKPCTCRYQWKSLGLTGHGWVRMTAEPGCPAHGKPRRA